MSDLYPIKRALISVSDKTEISKLGKVLSTCGVEIISTGGSAEVLRAYDIPVKDVSDLTIAEIKDAPVANPATSYTAPATTDVLTDEVLAAQYRSQADSLFKEAKTLREQAEELVPTKRKSKTTADG